MQGSANGQLNPVQVGSGGSFDHSFDNSFDHSFGQGPTGLLLGPLSGAGLLESGRFKRGVPAVNAPVTVTYTRTVTSKGLKTTLF